MQELIEEKECKIKELSIFVEVEKYNILLLDSVWENILSEDDKIGLEKLKEFIDQTIEKPDNSKILSTVMREISTTTRNFEGLIQDPKKIEEFQAQLYQSTEFFQGLSDQEKEELNSISPVIVQRIELFTVLYNLLNLNSTISSNDSFTLKILSSSTYQDDPLIQKYQELAMFQETSKENRSSSEKKIFSLNIVNENIMYYKKIKEFLEIFHRKEEFTDERSYYETELTQRFFSLPKEFRQQDVFRKIIEENNFLGKIEEFLNITDKNQLTEQLQQLPPHFRRLGVIQEKLEESDN